MSRRGSAYIGLAVLAALLLLAPSASAFKVRTSKGGTCSLDPQIVVKGDQVTYGLKVPSCSTKTGIKTIASAGIAVNDHQVASRLKRKFGTPPYSNVTTGDRKVPPPTSPTPGVPLPDLPPVPPLPIPLPITIPPLPTLPGLGGGSGGGGSSNSSYSRIDYSVQLGKARKARPRGKRGKVKTEKWRRIKGCKRTSTDRAGDTLTCQAFGVTGK